MGHPIITSSQLVPFVYVRVPIIMFVSSQSSSSSFVAYVMIVRLTLNVDNSSNNKPSDNHENGKDGNDRTFVDGMIYSYQAHIINL
jgi:hypothetical protein